MLETDSVYTQTHRKSYNRSQQQRNQFLCSMRKVRKYETLVQYNGIQSQSTNKHLNHNYNHLPNQSRGQCNKFNIFFTSSFSPKCNTFLLLLLFFLFFSSTLCFISPTKSSSFSCYLLARELSFNSIFGILLLISLGKPTTEVTQVGVKHDRNRNWWSQKE